jgi:hypothetical protein
MAKRNKRFRRVVLLQNVVAYHLGASNELAVKGGFRAGKLLKIDLAATIVKGGSKFYLVVNVKHENVYVNLTKGDFKPLKFSNKLLKSGNSNAIKKAMDIVLAKTETPKSSADGLCHYEDAAFDSADGFVFVHDEPEELSSVEKRAVSLKYRLSLPTNKIDEGLAERVRQFNDIVRHNSKGTGSGRAFN